MSFSVKSFVIFVSLAGAAAQAQLSTTAYRVLGQRTFTGNARNLAQGVEFDSPNAIALDTRGGTVRLYVADSGNHRILGYADTAAYNAGDAPTLVLGQPTRQSTSVNGIGTFGLNSPAALAVDTRTGDLYVADFGNNRVLRFPDPFANPARVEPDAVYGQPTAATAGVPTRASLNRPRGLAFDSNGNLWIADSNFHRIVRLGSGSLNAAVSEFDAVVGQRDLASGNPNAGGQTSGIGLDNPTAIAFDAQDNLLVSDGNNRRVLRFARSIGPGTIAPAANAVWGQPDFTSRLVSATPVAHLFSLPAGLAMDAAGALYVAVPAENRVLLFPPDSAGGKPATLALGQSDLISGQANTGVFPRARANTLFSPRDVRIDPAGNVFIADTGNHRALVFPAQARSAVNVWGQNDLRQNAANQAKAVSLDRPTKIAVDYSVAPFPLYISDASNSRVLGWRDATRFRDGDPADLVIGQPDFETVFPNSEGGPGAVPSASSLARPESVLVDRDGNLYVADTSNNRVLRFPRPFDQSGRITADAVIGQADFTSNTSAVVTASTLRTPAGLAFSLEGNLFVADTGNHRVLEFAPLSVNNPAALRVYGQPDMNAAEAPVRMTAQTLLRPRGLAVDFANNLYVADTGANRVVVYPNTSNAPAAAAPAAVVLGQEDFEAASAGFLRTPADVALDQSGNILVCDFGTHRVLMFPPLIFLPTTGGLPDGVVGQPNLNSTVPNWDSPSGRGSAAGLAQPQGIFVDRQDTLYVADTANARVLHFLRNAVATNAASNQRGAPVAAGSVVALASNQLLNAGSSGEARSLSAVWAEPLTTDWPVQAQGREVVLNDELRAPIYHLSGSQAIFQLPRGTPAGTSRVAVRLTETGELIAGASVAVAATAPALFTASPGASQAAAFTEDGRANSANNLAPRGSIVTLLGTGQGQVSPGVPDGTAAGAEPLSRTVTLLTSDVRACASRQSMCVIVGTGFGEIQFSGLAPSMVGVWQIKMRLPLTIASGAAVPVRVVINGAPSNTVTLAIR
ncbi:MAG: hypothetical protein IT162_01740 [Bryobacterales bacterium]|nr:hypothetical protein [Bryobacterales bacterium]